MIARLPFLETSNRMGDELGQEDNFYLMIDKISSLD